jgi:hypothetical protein
MTQTAYAVPVIFRKGTIICLCGASSETVKLFPQNAGRPGFHRDRPPSKLHQCEPQTDSREPHITTPPVLPPNFSFHFSPQFHQQPNSPRKATLEGANECVQIQCQYAFTTGTRTKFHPSLLAGTSNLHTRHPSSRYATKSLAGRGSSFALSDS